MFYVCAQGAKKLICTVFFEVSQVVQPYGNIHPKAFHLGLKVL